MMMDLVHGYQCAYMRFTFTVPVLLNGALKIERGMAEGR